MSKLAEQAARALNRTGVLDEDCLIPNELFVAGVASQVEAAMDGVIRDTIAPLIANEYAPVIDLLREALTSPINVSCNCSRCQDWVSRAQKLLEEK